MFRKMPIFLLALILVIVSIDPYLPLGLKSFLYSLSLTVKAFIIFVLPWLIFMLLFKTLAQLSSRATKMILWILGGVCCSNFLSTMISYGIGSFLFHTDLSIQLPQEGEGLLPLWNFKLPQLIANDYAMFAGIISGIAIAKIWPVFAAKASQFLDQIVSRILRGVTALLPFFIAGFVVKIVHDKTLMRIVSDYSSIFLIVALSQFAYILLIYWSVGRFRLSSLISSIRNMLPASVAGFSSMSSAAAMPLTLVGVEKNTENPALARLAVPATVNIHLIGDCFAIPIFALAILKNFGLPEPALSTYLLFACYFVMAKFSVAAIPGGGILVMLPILESHLGFTADMASLITALYILFDPVITCANVSGNGGFSMIMNNLLKKRTLTPS